MSTDSDEAGKPGRSTLALTEALKKFIKDTWGIVSHYKLLKDGTFGGRAANGRTYSTGVGLMEIYHLYRQRPQ